MKDALDARTEKPNDLISWCLEPAVRRLEAAPGRP